MSPRPSLLRLSLSFALLGALACGDDDRGGGRGVDAGSSGTDGSTSCASDADCDDGFDCTVDSCGVGGACRHDGIDERCEGALICEPGRGCVDEPSCGSDADCDDGFSCTLDSCGVGGECRNMPLDELCSEVGPGSSCDPTTGMSGTGCTEATGCEMDEDCDDGVDCTLDTCSVDNTCSHTTIDERCPDGEACTASGCFAPMDCETDEDCQDDDFCNGREFCEPEFGCRPAPEPRMCNDSDDCTMDSCDPELDMCVFRCDTSRPECECPEPETPCDGVFDITPAPMQTCAAVLGPAQVEYNIAEVEFSCVGPVLSVDARNVPNPRSPSPLTQNPRTDDGTFDVETVVAGGCEERYRLMGRFLDAATFEATFTAMYVDTSAFSECGLSGCVNQSLMVTGTRR
ncbi:MAG TPA: hypothetical protein RMH85_33355 [Polyangiaceae bacterium LLY-WYZ-15_(1-7)]|nr:hypothetical protein [Myxococcales bacterium]MAT24918.1 hypothetical protein [Sandaracinus sp.]HJK89886.1 hypothetical protein [Polyangiaceae bacterium LLY-WYZ-15_(1-7)]MBJ70160.1 hypothetical protein [Sandaracinus sp.]HJL06697.1 hypothetical protein [Polyangiaceae bacterium LLY-WYZ-15_(1-7)]